MAMMTPMVMLATMMMMVMEFLTTKTAVLALMTPV
jgi:hypothetical protein